MHTWATTEAIEENENDSSVVDIPSDDNEESVQSDEEEVT